MPDATIRLQQVPCPLCGSDSWDVELRSRAQLSPDEREFRFVRCRACDLVYLNPRVAGEDLGQYYDDSYLPHRGPEAWGPFAPLLRTWQKRLDAARVETVLAHASLGPNSRALDVGCGRPTFLRALVRRTGASAWGLDTSDGGWRGESWPDLRLTAGTIADLRTETPFDVVTFWHSLEHTPEPVACLKRARELSREGSALLIVEVPDYDAVSRRVQGSAWGGLHTPRHLTLFTPVTLRRTVEAAGWRVRRQVRHGTLDPFVLWWLGTDAASTLGARPAWRSFSRFAWQRAAAAPLVALQRRIPLGIQTIVAHRGEGWAP